MRGVGCEVGGDKKEGGGGKKGELIVCLLPKLSLFFNVL